MKLTLLLSGLIVTTTGYCAQDITIWELARNGNIDAIKRHMTTGADLDQKNMQQSGWAALHYASIYNRADAAKLLIENGANIEIKCDAGRTPLLEAAVRGQTKVAKVLIELGADVTASEKFGTSALGLAVMSGNTTMVELILKSGVNINANTDSTKKTSALTAIHIAASQPKTEIMRYLLMNGADVNAEGNHGFSPLHIAAMNGIIECVELLLTNGANVNSQVETGRNIGETPLDIVVLQNSKLTSAEIASRKEITALLRKHGGKTAEELKAAGK